MELVYLWVEEYKNIKNQGFNFSPRFECEFDGEYLTICDKKEKDNNCKNKDYIENFFGENINVTAIVGENGTGKSSVLEALLDDKIRDSLLKGLRIRVYQRDQHWLFRCDNESKNIIYTKEIFKSEIINLSTFEKWNEVTNIDEVKFKTIFYKNILDNNQFLSDDKIDITLTIDKELENGLYNYYSDNTKRIVNFLKNKNIKLEFPLPDKLYLEKSYFDLKEIITNILKPPRYNTYRNKLLGFIDRKNLKLNLWFTYHINNYNGNKFPDYKIDQIKEDESTFITYFETIQPDSKELINNVHNSLKSFTKNKEKLISNIENLRDDFIQQYSSIDPKGWLFRFGYGDITLSSGQYYFLLFFSKIFDAIKQETIKQYIIYIDESDLTLHPQWQKAFINHIVKFLEKNFIGYKFHIILTSHSPFILSDIPKENVIFLEKYKKDEDKNQKEGNCKNVTKDIELKTFGANIHTLLSNGFFMNDGLMGEFAKNKINEIKKFYELVKKCEKVINKSENIKNTIKNIYQGYEPNFRNIQKIIGEPFLQTIIKNYLEELEEIFDNKAYKVKKNKEFLDKFEIEELQKYLDEKNAKA